MKRLLDKISIEDAELIRLGRWDAWVGLGALCVAVGLLVLGLGSR